jgi:hypothetical protein
MPEYRDPLLIRVIASTAQTLATYPNYPKEQQHWTDRVMLQLEDGSEKPLSHFWKDRGPLWARAAIWAICQLGSPHFCPALKYVVGKEEQVEI